MDNWEFMEQRLGTKRICQKFWRTMFIFRIICFRILTKNKANEMRESIERKQIAIAEAWLKANEAPDMDFEDNANIKRPYFYI